MSLPLFRSKLDGGAKLCDCIVEPAFGLQSLRQISVRDGERRAKLDRMVMRPKQRAREAGRGAAARR